MKTKFAKFFLSCLVAGIVSCQDTASTSPTSEPGTQPLQLVARLTNAAGGDSIPTADLLRFRYHIGTGKVIDTSVPWSAHKLDFGVVNAGDSVYWQATAYAVNGAQRQVVWASQALKAQAKASGNSAIFTATTPVLASSYPLPTLTPVFPVGNTGKVALTYADSNYIFAFTAPASDSVKLNDTLLVGSNGSYNKPIKVGAGASVAVKVTLQDSLGAIAVLNYTLVRASAPGVTTVDSSSTAQFTTPSTLAYSAPNGTNSLNVVVQTTTNTASLKAGPVLLNGSQMSTTDSLTWTLLVSNLKVGVDTILTATPYVGETKGTTATVKVRQLAPGAVDSVVHLTILSPSQNATLSNATNSVTVSVKATSGLHLDSVKVAGQKLDTTTNDSLWSGTVTGLAVGTDSLKVIGYAKAGKKDSAVLVVVRRDVVGPALFSVPASTYANAQWVKLTDTTAGAGFMISTDNKTWSLYKDSVLVAVPETLYVKAGLTGRDSSSTSAIYVIQNVAKPVFSPVGGKYGTAQAVGVTTATPGATIQCSTTDNPTWTTCSSTATVAVSNSGMVYAKVTRAGMTTAQDSAMYTIVPMAAAPKFSVPAGTYTTTQSVTITSTTVIATIQWSTDSATWTTGNTVTISGPKKLYARAYATGMDTSYSSAQYVVAAVAPSFTVPTGTYTQAQSVGITTTASGATIRYSTDSLTWQTYSAPIPMTSSGKLYAYDSVPGLANSVVTIDTITIQVASPVFTPTPGIYTSAQSVTITDSTAGASLFYAVGPDSTTWYPYTAGATIPMNASGTLYAYAKHAGQANSKVTRAPYVIACAAPQFSVPSGIYKYDTSFRIYIIDSTVDAKIEYSVDSTTWKEYVSGSEIIVDSPVVLYARASYPGIDARYSKSKYEFKLPTPAFSAIGTTERICGYIGCSEWTYYDVSATDSAIGAIVQYSIDTLTWKTFSSSIQTARSTNGYQCPNPESATIYVRAVKDGWLTSDTATRIFKSNCRALGQ